MFENWKQFFGSLGIASGLIVVVIVVIIAVASCGGPGRPADELSRIWQASHSAVADSTVWVTVLRIRDSSNVPFLEHKGPTVCNPDSARSLLDSTRWVHRCFCGVFHEMVRCPSGEISKLPDGMFSVVATMPELYPFNCPCEKPKTGGLVDSAVFAEMADQVWRKPCWDRLTTVRLGRYVDSDLCYLITDECGRNVAKALALYDGDSTLALEIVHAINRGL